MKYEDIQIQYWANMLNESMTDKTQIDEVDLSKIDGTMTQVIKDKILETGLLNNCKTKQDVYDLVSKLFIETGINTPASRRLLLNISRTSNLTDAMQKVVNSYSDGAGFGVNGPRRRFRRGMYEEEQIDERRMTGPAAAARGGIDEIADMRQKLASGVVEFEFYKHNPEGGADILRHAVGTTSEQIIPVAERRRLDPNYDENIASYERRQNFIIWFWDLEKNAARCFNTNRFERIINYTQTNQRAGNNNVERFGDIYVHRDVDADMEGPIEQERVEEINREIDNALNGRGGAINDEGFGAVIAGGDLAIPDFNDIGLERGPNGEPILRIEIRKRGTDNDAPYELRINELRNVIRERWNVNVKRVIVDGEFQFN